MSNKNDNDIVKQPYNKNHYATPAVHVTSNKENAANSKAERHAVHEKSSSKHRDKVALQQEKTYSINDYEVIAEKELLARFGYTAQQTVGAGRYCRVRLAIDARADLQVDTDGNPVPTMVAIKVIDTEKISKDFYRKFLPREVDIWSRLQHPNLVRMLSTFNYGPIFCMSMEYLTEGDLLSYVQQTGPLHERFVHFWLWQLLDAIYYMHKNKIAHRDLKLENILIDDQRHLKICDFGFSRQFNGEHELSQTYCGSKAYSCPEILAGVPYDAYKADVWALGVIAFIMLTNKMPFNEHVKNNQVIIDAQRQRVYHYSSKLNITPACTMMVDRMMTFSQDERPTCIKVMQDHYWTSVQVVKVDSRPEHNYANMQYTTNAM